ncbi:unnamed protein product [Ilex paraguariensis]|uniref:G protein gamma domain-containing protein n=1 Tax=Ilex paraguariensis TaxID=185542 RepID=A0ABC8SPU1_9AQUA
MAPSGGSSILPSLPPPRPKSPPTYPDLYGKRRELAKVQMLEREIGFLEEELKSVDGLQPSSRCCKEVADFVVANADPLLPTSVEFCKLPFSTSCLFTAEVKRFVGLVAYGNGLVVCPALCAVECPALCAVECPASISHGPVVVNAVLSKCHTVATAYVTACPVSSVQYPSANVAPGHTADALTNSHAAEVVASFNVLHAQTSLAVDVHAVVLSVQRYFSVPAVQQTAATLVIYVTSIFIH